MGETLLMAFAVDRVRSLGSSFRSTNSGSWFACGKPSALGDPGIDLGVAIRFLRLIDFGYSIEHGTACPAKLGGGGGVTGAPELTLMLREETRFPTIGRIEFSIARGLEIMTRTREVFVRTLNPVQ